MKSKRKKFTPLFERLTPAQLTEFRREMAEIRRRFDRRMKRKPKADPMTLQWIIAKGKRKRYWTGRRGWGRKRDAFLFRTHELATIYAMGMYQQDGTRTEIIGVMDKQKGKR